MPSKVKPIFFRLPWLQKAQGDRSNKIAKAILEQSRESIEAGKCPRCGKPFEECDYFRSLED